jgi:Arc/MetJ-type ribon-helix-helix transcriptional regulator
MAVSVNATVSMTPEMERELREKAEKHGMSRAEYIRHLIRQADDSPFEAPDSRLEDDSEETEVSA